MYLHVLLANGRFSRGREVTGYASFSFVGNFDLNIQQIMEKYRGLCEDGRVFPVPNYQSCMDSLKRLGKRCGITKPLSWHSGRHSFATSVCLSNGVPIETVSSMLGHKNIKTTQVYAKITKEKLSKDVEKLSQQINNIEEFTFGNVCNDNTKLSMTGWKVMIMKMNQMLNGEKSDWILTPMQAATLTGKTVKTFSSKQIACKKEHIRYG